MTQAIDCACDSPHEPTPRAPCPCRHGHTTGEWKSRCRLTESPRHLAAEQIGPFASSELVRDGDDIVRDDASIPAAGPLGEWLDRRLKSEAANDPRHTAAFQRSAAFRVVKEMRFIEPR